MKIIYIDMDKTICDFEKAHVEDTVTNLHVKYPQSIPGFFTKLEPIQYALSCISQLEESGKFDIWFATAPSIKNLHCYSEKAEWIRNYFGEEYLHRLIITPDKSKLIGDYLIDDMACGKGQDAFKGTLIQLGSKFWPTWIDITARLLDK